MKARPVLLFALLLAARAWSTENPIPTPLPTDRYDAIGEKSPFALATPVAAPAAPQASFAANWFVSGIARVGETDFVTVKARDLSTQFSLFGHEPHAGNGVSVASVNWSETIGKSTVILQKGSETAKLEFNEADARSNRPLRSRSHNRSRWVRFPPGFRSPPARPAWCLYPRMSRDPACLWRRTGSFRHRLRIRIKSIGGCALSISRNSAPCSVVSPRDDAFSDFSLHSLSTEH
jgi:hypothetical protein